MKHTVNCSHHRSEILIVKRNNNSDAWRSTVINITVETSTIFVSSIPYISVQSNLFALSIIVPNILFTFPLGCYISPAILVLIKPGFVKSRCAYFYRLEEFLDRTFTLVIKVSIEPISCNTL